MVSYWAGSWQWLLVDFHRICSMGPPWSLNIYHRDNLLDDPELNVTIQVTSNETNLPHGQSWMDSLDCAEVSQ